MGNIKVRDKVVPLWFIVVFLVSGIAVPLLAYVWQSVTVPFEVREPLEILSYPSEFSLFPGETVEFNVTLQNHASTNYSVIFDYQLNDTYYLVNYVKFSEEEYIVVPGLQTLNAWLFVEPNAPPTQASLTINFLRIKPEVPTTTIFEDNFEGYSVSTFPYAGGWELWTKGAGNEYQVIVDSVSVSPSKSLQLRGYPNWVATASKRYTADSSRIGFEVYVRAKESGGARVGFTKWVNLHYITIRVYSGVMFASDGKILLAGYGELEPWVAGEWYKVKQVIDRSDDTCSVWINDVLRASDVALDTNDFPGEYHYNETEAFSLISSYEIIDAYFDDVKIFQYGP